MKKSFLLRITLMLLTMLCTATAWADTYDPVSTDGLSSYDLNAPFGFGASVTGSEDETPVTVTTLNELTTALSGTDKKTIYVSGTITFTGSVSINGVSNKTIYGLPNSALSNTTLDTSDKTKSGILYLKNCSNIIMRNLTFLGAGAYDYDGNDNLTLDGCTNVWVDHCDFQDGVDGNFDCKGGSDNICVSWCRFRYLKAPTSGGSGGSNDHRFSNLWGSGDSATGDDGKLNTTFYACWWDDGCKQRMPRVRYGKIHILNCYYSSSNADYGIGAGYKSNIYVENSHFAATGNPWQTATSSGYTDYNIKLVGNQGASDDTQSSGTITQFVPSYTYTAMPASSVSSEVSSHAGATLTYAAAATYANLIDFPTSTTGITVNGNTELTTAEGYDVCKFSNGYTGDNAGKNAALTVSGGFKAGDIVTIAGFIKNSDSSKYGTVVLFTATNETGSEGITNIKTFANFANLANNGTITEQTYTLESDYDRLFLGRSGNTATNLTVIRVQRVSEEEGTGKETTVSTAVLSMNLGANGAEASAANSITGAAGCAAEGFTIAITGNTGKNWSAGNGNITYKGTAYKTLKNSNGAQNTVTLPTGMYAHKVEFYATTNATDGDGKLTEINGTSCSDAVTSRQDYTNPTYISKRLSTGVNSFTFTFSTKQVCFIAVVTYSNSETLEAEEYTVTFTNNDADAYGTVPAAVTVSEDESVTIPTNKTLYKSGYTLTGWSDGTTYAIGANYTPTADVTLNPVFTPNTASMSDVTVDKTVTWYFGKSNGAVDYDGSVNANVQQVTIGNATIDLGIKMLGGSHDGHNDEWMNNQQKDMMVPVIKGAIVKAKVFYTNNASFNGEEITYDADTHGAQGNVVYTYTYTGDEPSEIAVNVGNQFLSYISVTYPTTNTEANVGYTNTWYFGKSNDAPEFALQKSAEYTYTVNDYSLVINTDAGKLNNASRSDQWAQCNDGTTFKVPVYAGSKLTWGCYNSGSETGFTIDGQLYNEYYVATADGTVEMKAKGIGYLSYIKIEPITLYEVSGTITGADINDTPIIFTANGNGQPYTAVIANAAFTLSLPADTYTPGLSDDVAYVISSPTSTTVSAAGDLGVFTIEQATAQTVSGAITNAPAEAFTLTFTGNGHTETVECEAGATSFSKELMPDTYVISSNVGTLSTLSQESFKIVKTAVTHNIYFPEAASPAATEQTIIVDNTITTETANNYKSVTNALAAAKAGNIAAPIITLTSGQTYREQVVIDQANVTFTTTDTGKAKITFYYGIGYCYYSLSASGVYDKDRAMTRNSIKKIDPVRWGATVLLRGSASGFKAENITFENSFNQYYTDEEVIDGVMPNGCQSITYDRTLGPNDSGYKAADSKAVTERAAAIAFENNPSGCELYNCEFVGSQDTFYSSGSIYVKDCSITGNTDYIFGGGSVVFDNCDLVIGGYSDKETSAYITANSPSASEAYIFRDCTVKSGGRAHVSANLGRDWGGAAASVYYFNLKNEIGDKLSYKWTNMGGGIAAGKANLHIYDFDPTVNANYNTTGSTGANINRLLSDAEALSIYADVVSRLGFTPEHIYDGNVVLDEASYYNVCRIAATDNVERTVELTRSIGADKWNTIVLPFDLTEAQVKAAFGNDVKVAELTTSTPDNLKFSTATDIVANQPYAIKVKTAVSNATFDGVTVKYSEAPTQTVGDWQFVGTYTKGGIPEGSYFFSSNMLYHAADDTNTIKAFRGWFTYTGATPARQLTFSIDSDSETTGISEIENSKSKIENYYNLNGQRVEQPTKGLYIVNGKKVIVK